jgi:hypothetical protein
MLITWWWFGTFIIFHNIWDVILPIVELIFFKMVIAPPTRYKGLQGPPLITDTPPMLKDIVEIVFFYPLIAWWIFPISFLYVFARG